MSEEKYTYGQCSDTGFMSKNKEWKQHLEDKWQRQQDADRLAQFACAIISSDCRNVKYIADVFNWSETMLAEFKKRTEGK